MTRKRGTLRATLLGVALAAFLTPAAPALAGKSDDASAVRFKEGVVAHGMTKRVANGERIEIPAGSGDTVAAAACRYVTVSRWAENVFGSTLWKYFQRIDWCYNGSSVTSVSRRRWGETYWPGWSFKGHTGNQTSGGVGWTGYQAWTQGHFCLASYFDCVQDRYPWIDITVWRNGTYNYSTGG